MTGSMAFDKRNLRPSKILFTHDSISNSFRRDSDHHNKLIGETLDDLLNGIIQISDIPEIRVFKSKNRWYTRNNRRLWVFRKMEANEQCTDIPVQITDETSADRRATKNGGSTIQVRGDEGGTYWRTPSSLSTDTPSTPGTSTLSTSYNLRTKRPRPESPSPGNESKAKKRRSLKKQIAEDADT